MSVQIPSIIRKILSSLNLHDEQEIENYLFPRLERLPSPMLMKGMKEAVALFKEEVARESEIIVWGDYDVDGTTGTSLLVNFFRELGIEPHWHIPNRLTDGYGLDALTFSEIREKYFPQKEFLLITVDCGISNFKEILEILAMGGRAIVTDHHQIPTGELPGCITLNPNQDGCGFQDQKLAGVGVAFYFAAAIRAAFEKDDYFENGTKPNMKDYLGFVALGTIADLVEMTATNRILVRAGMESLPNSGIPGLRALIGSAGLQGQSLATEDISFLLGPRINAAGRLGKADVAVQLMTSDNEIVGHKLSRQLESFNEERKNICKHNLELALSKIDIILDKLKNSLVIVGDFHVGIIGIVASRLVEMYGRPAIVFARSESGSAGPLLKGSGRSIPGINLLDCLHSCASNMVKYGGHSMAAGLTIEESAFNAFFRGFDQAVELQRLNQKHSQVLRSNAIECSMDEIMNKDALEYLQRLEPFGPENEQPLFVDSTASVVSCKAIGENGRHLQLTLRGKYENYRGIGFGLGKKRNEIQENPLRKISFTPMMNRFRGAVEWQLRITDI